MVLAGSRFVYSAQMAVHPQLAQQITRHYANPWQKPIASHTKQAFNQTALWLSQRPQRNLIIDSGCGTGLSTLALAEYFSDANVIGIDRSLARLQRQPTALPTNAYLIRAELADFWRLANQAHWQLSHHFILYPNPYPKIQHLQRRWHGHPVFPTLLALGGCLQIRTNWRVYAQEFACAYQLVTQQPAYFESFVPMSYLSPFEKKYAQSQHQLWRLIIHLSSS